MLEPGCPHLGLIYHIKHQEPLQKGKKLKRRRINYETRKMRENNARIVFRHNLFELNFRVFRVFRS